MQECAQLKDQLGFVSNTNISLNQQNLKSKIMVETLEAVLLMFYTSPSRKDILQDHYKMVEKDSAELYSNGSGM